MRTLPVLIAATVVAASTASAQSLQTSVQNSEPQQSVISKASSVQQNVTNVTQPQPTPEAKPVSGPRADAARAGFSIKSEAPAPTAKTAPVAPQRMGQSVALMAVGGAALVTGLVIGGDGGTILAIGGTVVGLVGLYQYLK